MRLSAFTPLGLLRLKAGPPDARSIYDASISGLGGQYNVDPGSRMDATAYAQAIGIARARRRLRQAAGQRLAAEVREKLVAREAEYQVSPAMNDSILTRRAVLSTRMQVPVVPTRVAIENALRALLGSNFLYYRPTPISEAVSTPATIGAWPMNLQPPTIPRKAIRLLDPISFVGTRQVARYEVVSLGAQDPLTPSATKPVVGESYVFDVSQCGQEDRATLDTVVDVSGIPLVAATWTRPHDAGTIGYSHPLPSWQSTKRHSLVVVFSLNAAKPETRRKINELMARMVGATSTWDIVAGSSSATRPLSLTATSLGFSTLPTFSLP